MSTQNHQNIESQSLETVIRRLNQLDARIDRLGARCQALEELAKLIDNETKIAEQMKEAQAMMFKLAGLEPPKHST